MRTNITDSFEYHAEEAKQSFQNNITSILEIQSLLNDKSAKAKNSNKEGFFVTLSEAETINSWLLNACSELMGDYKILQQTNHLVNLNYRVASNLLVNKTPNLEDLLKV